MRRLKFITHHSAFLSYGLVALSLFNLYQVLGRQIQSAGELSSRNRHATTGSCLQDPGPPKRPLQYSVVFETNLTDPKPSDMFIECDLVEYGEWVELQNLANMTFTLRELNQLESQSLRNPWMSCRFLRSFRNGNFNGPPYGWVYTPPRTPQLLFDPYYNVSLSGGGVTRVILNDTGIFVGQQFLSHWGVTNEDGISSEPGYKLLNFQNGVTIKPQCRSLCATRHELIPPLCQSDAIDNYPNVCVPRVDYDIKKYAFNGILSSMGTPCTSKCELTEENTFKCRVRRYDMIGVPPFELCSPSAGLTTKGSNCTGPCIFQRHSMMTCPTLTSSQREFCSA